MRRSLAGLARLVVAAKTGQQAGPQGTVSDEEVQKVVKLTGDQKEKIKSMVEEMQKDMQELRRDRSAEARTKITALQKEVTEKSAALLTDDQKKAWKELVGKEFEYKPDAPAGGGRPGGKRPEKKDPTL